MSKTNCINCGAAKDTSDIKCPFCGTTYLDLTAIDFSSDDPVACEFVLPYTMNGTNKVVMSMLARPKLEEISQSSTKTTYYGSIGNWPLFSFINSYDVNVGVSFEPLTRKDNNTIFTFRPLGDSK